MFLHAESYKYYMVFRPDFKHSARHSCEPNKSERRVTGSKGGGKRLGGAMQGSSGKDSRAEGLCRALGRRQTSPRRALIPSRTAVLRELWRHSPVQTSARRTSAGGARQADSEQSVAERERTLLPQAALTFFVAQVVLHSPEAVIDGAEGVSDDRAEDHESCNNNDGDQNKN